MVKVVAERVGDAVSRRIGEAAKCEGRYLLPAQQQPLALGLQRLL